MSFKPLLGAAVSLVLLAASSQASALLINVKVGAAATGVTQSGAAVLGSASSWWNNYQYSSSTPNLVSVVDDLNAAVAGVQLTIANSSGVGNLPQPTGAPSFLMSTGKYMNTAGIWTMTFNGLAANTLYQFIGYSANISGSNSYGGNWSVTTGTAGSGTFSNDGTSVDIASGVGKAYVDFTATTDATGKLVVRDTFAGARVPLQGFQLSSVTAVPEPSSAALLLGGGILMLAYRRRQAR